MCTWEYDIEMCPQCGIGNKTNYHLMVTCTCTHCCLCSSSNNHNKLPRRGRPETCPHFQSSRSEKAPIREMTQRCEDCAEAEKEEDAKKDWLDAWFGGEEL